MKRAIYTGRVSPTQAKRAEEMQAVADALSLLANIIMAWNTTQMQAVLDRWDGSRHGDLPRQIVVCVVADRTSLGLSRPAGLVNVNAVRRFGLI